jgi:DNA invertase Pin-like site-specific DNA recombinase
MIYGYARVSTKGQERDGNGLEAQERVLREHGAEIIYKDSFTGTKKHRPELDKLLSVVKDGDTVVVVKLDRIARSTIQGCELMNELFAKGVAVNVLNMGMMDNSTTGKLIRSIFFAFAEFERDMIVERTSEGKAVAREREGFREGRPTKEIPDFEKFLKKQKDGQMTVNECCKALGIGRSTWYDRVREVS